MDADRIGTIVNALSTKLEAIASTGIHKFQVEKKVHVSNGQQKEELKNLFKDYFTKHKYPYKLEIEEAIKKRKKSKNVYPVLNIIRNT